MDWEQRNNELNYIYEIGTNAKVFTIKNVVRTLRWKTIKIKNKLREIK